MVIDFEQKKRSYARRIAPQLTRSRELDRAVMRFEKLSWEERKKEAAAVAEVFYGKDLSYHLPFLDSEVYRFHLDAITRNSTKKQIQKLIKDSSIYYSKY